ncbi:FYVE zinc finger [Trichostrongylus colubriformis]|uniref:1-phosphatidylinositol-3-phosphate 5-kinase n=1 Tax=Trichostrongylus colubriformis TaxID=6319 RepID=A0AAN8FNM9_TRICO
MTDSSKKDSDGNGLTFFNRLSEEAAEENLSASSNVLSSIFGRFWRPQSTSEPETSSSAKFYLEDDPGTDEKEDGVIFDPLSGNTTTRTEDISSNTPNAHDIRGISRDTYSRLAPSASSNSLDSDGKQAKFTDKLTSIFKGGTKQGLIDYDRSNFRQYWMPDSTGKECYQCEERFSTFRRRHHCRLCGQIFCAKCCNIHVPGSALGYIGDLRLCHYCAKMVAQYLPTEEERRQSIEDVNIDSPANCPSSTRQEASLNAMPSNISTVSSGAMLWARQSGVGASISGNKDPSFTQLARKPPSMLCVNELYLQHENRVDTEDSIVASLQDEEDSGPDWFRNMDPDTLIPIKDDSKVRSTEACAVENHFDPVPITVGVPCEKASENKQSSVKASLSFSPSKTHLDDDIDRAFDLRAEQILSYLCSRERIRDLRWKPIILRLAKEIAHTVKVDVAKRRDSMNIVNYVHVKKLYLDHEDPQAELVWGVVCSKTVSHKSMAEPLRDASVMIVAGSIEYERVPGRLSTLEPILNQEGEFLSKQVERILSRRPSVLLVEGYVSRLASDLLREANVRLVVNVSQRVLQRVARSTGADILPSSDAQLIQQNIGFCPYFAQREFTLKDGRIKHLLIVNECPPDRGCSVLLKCANLRELKAVKRILLFLTSVLYSSRLEIAFLNMLNIRMVYQISSCDVCEARREAIDQDTEKSDFEQAIAESVLSASPFIEYEPPYLESVRGRNCSLLPYFNVPIYRFFTAEDFDARIAEEENEVQENLARQQNIPIPDTPRHCYATCGGRNADNAENLSYFRAFGGVIFRKRLQMRKMKDVTESSKERQRSRRHDMLDPYVHQRVAVLFGSFSPKSPNAPYFCVRPWVVNMEFYGSHDMTLGEFLTKYCFNKSYECPSSNCDVPMLDHSRKLVYGRVCVEVTTQIVVSGSDESSVANAAPSQIFAWNYCDSCKLSSPVVPLSTSVWHLSFGKFLDYIAYATGFFKGDVTPGRQDCSHCFFHKHTHFYSQGNYVASFKVSSVRPYNVQFSPVQCRIVPNQYSKQALMDGVTRMASLADDIVRTAEDRLRLFTQHDHYSQYAGTFHTVLRQIVDRTIALIEEKRKYAEELTTLDRVIIPSNDMYAVKANEALMHIREAIYQLITTWNDQSTVLAATVRAVKKNTEDSGVVSEVTDIGLERIDDPFPTYLHLGLKLQPRVGVVVRDIMDSRGNYKPDIGSIIAYALSSADYEEHRRKQRDAAKGEQPPLNLNSNSVAVDEQSLAAEHLEIEFQDSQASYYVKVYYAGRFRLLRKLLLTEGEEAFIRSLSQSTIWTPQGGKSGSFFYRTQDDRFVVKQMSRFEIQSFVEFAPHYFEYVKTAVVENKLTALCKVYGVFRVGYKSKATQLKFDILVMEYLFYKHNVNQVWDLKGSLRNRMASTGKSTSDLVLLDENLMKDLWNKQLYIYPHAKAALNQAISNDSHFLSSQHVMDYSLLVGVDETNGELILGIVDYMRTYTLDKKLESWVKIVAIPGAHLPTILSPEMYCTRFSEAIDTYFPVVPDQWTGLGSAVSY